MIVSTAINFGLIHRGITKFKADQLLLILLLAAMTYNQVHYFRVNHLADFTQNGHTKTPVG